MHLNKLIVSDFPKKTTIEQELLKYRLLNIFYNRENEIKFLEELLSEELNVITNEKKHLEWSKKAKKEFNQFRHKLKLERRRKKENLPLNSLEKAKYNFNQSCAGAPRCKQRGMFAPPLEIPLKEIITLNSLVLSRS